MIFEKKVIIGSLVSFLTAAIGVIAVFFPDLLNLQKKKMESFEIVVDTKVKYDELSQFLDKRKADEKVFKITALFCTEYVDSKGFISEINNISITDIHSEWVNIDDKDEHFSFYESKEPLNEEKAQMTEYSFPIVMIEDHTHMRDFSRDCHGFELRGYAFFEKTEEANGSWYETNANYFTEVPKDQVRFKDY